jgi:hypothetical protein
MVSLHFGKKYYMAFNLIQIDLQRKMQSQRTALITCVCNLG